MEYTLDNCFVLNAMLMDYCTEEEIGWFEMLEQVMFTKRGSVPNYPEFHNIVEGFKSFYEIDFNDLTKDQVQTMKKVHEEMVKQVLGNKE